MPSLATALLALALHERPPTESGVWLDAPPAAGTVVSAPLDLAGEAQSLEGVLRVEAFVVRGTSVTSVASYEPSVPVGEVPFSLRWDPSGTAPGRVTIRVVATTLLRGFSTEVKDIVVPAPARPAVPRPPAVATRPAPPSAAPVLAARRAVRRWVPAPAPRVVDTSGRGFGTTAPVLPYVTRPVAAAPPAVAPPVLDPVRVADRSGWASFAGGLLLLLVCSHLHRLLRPQPVPKERR